MKNESKQIPDLAGLTHIEESIEMYVPRIMILVEGDLVKRLIGRELHKKGYEIDEVSSFTDGMKKLGKSTYKLIICDIKLNGESCIPFLVYCRRNHASTYVIALAAKLEMRFAIEAMKSGASHVLQKPINLNELLIQVKEGLKGPIVGMALETGVSIPSGCKLIKEIGKGNVCTVYLVKRDGIELAIKIPNGNSWGMEQIKRFFREADILAKISHPNIVQIHEYGVSDCNEIPYIIMEYLPGGTLGSYMRGNMVEMDAGISMLTQLLSALTEIHGHGLLHRDIKPQNVLFSKQKTPKLLDFGLVRITDSSLTMSHAVLGTPAYMAPESFKGSSKIDERADIFSLGVIAYEMLTGSHPFEGANVADVVSSIQNVAPKAPSTLNPKIPVNLQSVLAGMLSKNPSNRYSSALETLDDFKKFRELKYDFIPKKPFDDLDGKHSVWRK